MGTYYWPEVCGERWVSYIHVNLFDKLLPHAASIMGHVGDGNIHCSLLVDPEDSQAMQTAKELAARMAR